MVWKTMAEWRASGPPNGDEMLLLLADGSRVVGKHDGMSLSWFCNGSDRIQEKVVAWFDLPPVPQELISRLKYIRETRDRLNKLEDSPL